MPDPTRREFLLEASAVAAGAAALTTAAAAADAPEKTPADQPRSEPPSDNPSDALVLGFIGVGGQGWSLLRSFVTMKDVRVAWVCDVDAKRIENAARTVRQAPGGRDPKTDKDLRRVLDDKSVDAVVIATPDHWHAPATVLACDAGKHVYVEKPASHNLREGRLMIDAARRTNRVVQVGTQSRSTPHVIRAMQLLRDGAIGDVLVSKAWNSQRRSSIGKQKPTDPPPHLDFDLWLGPAPAVPYRTNLLPGVWRWWHAFGTGDIGNDGVHDIDIARWGLGVDTHPSTASAAGGKYFFDDDMQFPDTQYVCFEYPGAGIAGRPKQLIFEQRIWSPYTQEGHENGNAFYGTKGMMVLGKHKGWQLFGPKNEPLDKMEAAIDSPAHHRDFLDCCRTGRRPRADIETGHLSSSLSHLGNIATRLGRTVRFDPKTERATGDEEADRLLRREYREHWAMPKGV